MSRSSVTDRECRLGEAGYATVWVVTGMAAVAFAAAVSAGEGVAIVERHRAAHAADAAALVAALHAIDGPADACAAASTLARDNGAVITSCTLAGTVSEVVVRVGLPGPLATFGSATGRARAGPASVTPDVPQRFAAPSVGR